MKKQIIPLLLLVVVIINAETEAQRKPINSSNILPEDFTLINAEVFAQPENNDYFFFAFMRAWTIYPNLTPYLVIADNYGTPVYFKKSDGDVMDFKIQPNGMLSYYDDGLKKHLLMNHAFRPIDTISYLNNPIDFHDFHILENGNYLLLGVELRLVDMDTVVEGGHPGVTVAQCQIQIQDNAGNIVFEWSGWDHFQITDTNVDLLDENYIDATHTNAVEMDSDSTLLISNRNMDEITKINMHTGEIIWRLGGKNNQFTYIGNDTLGFAGQHDIRRLPDGSYQLFDNGWNHNPLFSCALRFELDEINMTALVLQRLRSQPDILGSIMGNAQHLTNGNTIVGWGSGDPNITEFDSLGNKLVEFSYETVSYRAYKFPFQTTAMYFVQNSLAFDPVKPGDTATTTLGIFNNLQEDIVINRLVSRTGLFSFQDSEPILIEPGCTQNATIIFTADTIGAFNDVLTIAYDLESDTLTRRIAKQISANSIVSEDASIIQHSNISLTAFPNPVRGITTISSSQSGEKYFEIYDISGSIIRSFSSDEKNFLLDLSGQSCGIYFLSVSDEKGTRGLLKLLKE
ncbi:MAG: aryl-sulfate sulfotransferase [Bacteroidales bacterium]|nr:aryl-sulfate sulfotransferase [Bacteroidales bacterium]